MKKIITISREFGAGGGDVVNPFFTVAVAIIRYRAAAEIHCVTGDVGYNLW